MSGRVQFIDEGHRYLNDSGDLYTSVTTLIAMYKPKKNWWEIAEKYAIKKGGTAQYWMDKWGQIKEDACEVGTEFHDRKEREMIRAGAVIQEKKMYTVASSSSQFKHNSLISLDNGMYTELVLWNHRYRIAGKADKILIEKPYFDIDDYKTNKDIDEEGFYNFKLDSYEKMLHPINHLDNCTLIHYELQLSIYAFMLECFGFKCRSLQFRHHKKDGLGIIPENPTRIYNNLPYRKKEVIDLLNHNLARVIKAQ